MAMLRGGLGATLPPLRGAYAARCYAPLSRGVASSAPLLRRDDDRLPRGHVRPRSRRAQYQQEHQQYPPQHDHQQSQAHQAGGFGAFGGFDGPTMDSYAPVRTVDIPRDPKGVLADSHAAYEILAHESLVIVRQLEMLNVFMGFEQANRYAIHSSDGNLVGFLAEEDHGFKSTLSRQFLHTHRPFRSVVMDRTGKPVLWIRRPFAFINSRIFVHAADEPNSPIVGESQQQWHPWRRKYNLFQARPDEVYSQFARIDGGFLAWDFWLKDRDDRLCATINRNFRGLGRELFTDTGQYVIRFDAAGQELDIPGGSTVKVQGQKIILPDRADEGLTLDQRAMTLATAVSIDFDYFSRHSGSGGMGFPFFMWGGGDGTSEARREDGGGGGSSGGDVSTPSSPAPGMPGGTYGGVGDAAGMAGAAGAAGMMGGRGRPMTEDEMVYGRQPERGNAEPPTPGQQAEGFDYPPQEGYEEPMEDPWAQQSDDSGEGLFGGWGGGGGDGGGDWF